LGFYPVNPSNGEFIIGSPQVKKAVIQINNQQTFTIKAKNFSKKNIYQDHPSLNNVKIDNSIVRYNEIMKGGTLTFRMTKKIN
jgi:putative alpha-1,2-mannosidase